jgi:hypothetical protein
MRYRPCDIFFHAEARPLRVWTSYRIPMDPASTGAQPRAGPRIQSRPVLAAPGSKQSVVPPADPAPRVAENWGTHVMSG